MHNEVLILVNLSSFEIGHNTFPCLIIQYLSKTQNLVKNNIGHQIKNKNLADIHHEGSFDGLGLVSFLVDPLDHHVVEQVGDIEYATEPVEVLNVHCVPDVVEVSHSQLVRNDQRVVDGNQGIQHLPKAVEVALVDN